MSKTPVIFRKFPTGEVIALFPQDPGTNDANTCGNYMHIGQHGSGNASFGDTKAARYPEYESLMRELQGIGYDLEIRKRFSDKDRAARLAEINRAAIEMRDYAVSTGNGNDGISHLYPNYIVRAPVDSEYLIARLACLASFNSGWGRKWAKREMSVDEMGPDAAQACIYDPPGRDGRGYSEHNGAWRLWDVFSADEASDATEAPRYDTLEACFGAALVRAHREKV